MTAGRNSAARLDVVTDAGPAAPWLTLVHALSQHRGVFSAQVEAFRASHRLLLIDLPGHGLSAGIPGPYGLEEYSAAVLAALDEARVERTIYFGTHTGRVWGCCWPAGSHCDSLPSCWKARSFRAGCPWLWWRVWRKLANLPGQKGWSPPAR